jgi:hypothetical protein
MGFASKFESDSEKKRGSSRRTNRRRSGPVNATVPRPQKDLSELPTPRVWAGEMILKSRNEPLLQRAANQVVERFKERGASARRFPTIPLNDIRAWRCSIKFANARISVFWSIKLPPGVERAAVLEEPAPASELVRL